MLNSYLPQILIFVGLLLTFLGGLISFTRDEKTQKENQTLVIENKRLLESNLGLSELIKNNLTGGDGYPSVTPAIYIDQKMIVFELENKSEYPIYDLKLSFTDPVKRDEIISKHSDINQITDEEFNTYHIKKELGNISPRTIQRIYEYSMPPNTNKERFIFTMICRNGHYVQIFDITRDAASVFIIHGRIEKITDGIQTVIKTY